MYEIIDNNGVIFSGNEEDMYIIWYGILQNKKEYQDIDWEGDLKLIHVIDVHK